MLLRIGTRGSKLALAQTQSLVDQLRAIQPHLQVNIEVFSTRGDVEPDRPLPELGAKGLFTAELASALRDGRIDLAVHSAKDLPTEMAPELCIGCVPARHDPRDALIANDAASLETLPEGATVGTSSSRRAAQLLTLRPDLRIVPLRGNIQTRIEKVRQGQCDATLLAIAGLQRAGLAHQVSQILEAESFLPAAGQGCLAIQVHRRSDAVRELLSAMHHEPSAIELAAERLLVSRLQGGCRAPIGVLARADGHRLSVTAGLFMPDGSRHCRAAGSGTIDALEPLIDTITGELCRQGAERILAACR